MAYRKLLRRLLMLQIKKENFSFSVYLNLEKDSIWKPKTMFQVPSIKFVRVCGQFFDPLPPTPRFVRVFPYKCSNFDTTTHP